MDYLKDAFVRYCKFLLVLFFITPILLPAQEFMQLCENENTDGIVTAFEKYQGEIYATGYFNRACGETAGFISKWNTTNNYWTPTNIRLNAPGHSLRSIHDKLYITTHMQRIDSNWVYIYDGTRLQKLGAGVFNSAASFLSLAHIYDVIEFQDKIIACGEFDRVGNTNVSGIMQWDGTSWSDLGGGFSIDDDTQNPVLFPHRLFVHDNMLYAVGNFQYAGGKRVNGIAKWDGNEWHAMGMGFNGVVYAITFFDGAIHVGGDFTKSGDTDTNRIAKWNGTAWEALDFGFDRFVPNDYVFVSNLTKINESLFIGGGLRKTVFKDGSSLFGSGIFEYKDGTLETFNGGVANNDIEAIIQADENNILIGGGISTRGYWGLLDLDVATVETVESDTRFQVYPNPFLEQIQIEADRPIDGLYIVDLAGKRQLIETSQYGQIDMRALESGFYFLEIHTEEGIFVKKVVKL